MPRKGGVGTPRQKRGRKRGGNESEEDLDAEAERRADEWEAKELEKGEKEKRLDAKVREVLERRKRVAEELAGEDVSQEVSCSLK